MSALEFLAAAFLVQPDQFRHLLPVNLRRRETQFLFERLLQNSDIPVLTKNQRYDHPIIACPHLAIGSAISPKRLPMPFGNVRRLPTVVPQFVAKWCRFVTDIARAQQFASSYRLDCFSHQHAVHYNVRARREILRRKLMLRAHVGTQHIRLAAKRNRLALAQIRQGNQYVVSRIKLQNSVVHSGRSIFPRKDSFTTTRALSSRIVVYVTPEVACSPPLAFSRQKRFALPPRTAS